MSKMSWVIIAMIIWALVSSYWYCTLQSGCTKEPTPIVATNKVEKAEPVKVQQPVKEVQKEVVRPEPQKQQELEVQEPLAPKEVQEQPVNVPKIDQQCIDYLDGNLKPGSSTNAKQVATKVEEFLNQYENTNLVVDGIYGAQDVQAINTFQQKYSTQILAPLGLTEPTGNVLGSTRAHINKLYCQNSNRQ